MAELKTVQIIGSGGLRWTVDLTPRVQRMIDAGNCRLARGRQGKEPQHEAPVVEPQREEEE